MPVVLKRVAHLEAKARGFSLGTTDALLFSWPAGEGGSSAHGFCLRFGKAENETCRCLGKRNIWLGRFLPERGFLVEAGVQLWPRNGRVSLRRDAACALAAPGSEHPPDVVKVVIPRPWWELGY